MTKIIGISSYTGGGKTTLVRRLAKWLNATFLIWDDYDEAGFMTHPKDWRSWLAEGSSSNAWSVPKLAEDLAKLKKAKGLFQLVTARASQPHPILLLKHRSVTNT